MNRESKDLLKVTVDEIRTREERIMKALVHCRFLLEAEPEGTKWEVGSANLVAPHGRAVVNVFRGKDKLVLVSVLAQPTDSALMHQELCTLPKDIQIKLIELIANA